MYKEKLKLEQKVRSAVLERATNEIEHLGQHSLQKGQYYKTHKSQNYP